MRCCPCPVRVPKATERCFNVSPCFPLLQRAPAPGALEDPEVIWVAAAAGSSAPTSVSRALGGETHTVSSLLLRVARCSVVRRADPLDWGLAPMAIFSDQRSHLRMGGKWKKHKAAAAAAAAVAGTTPEPSPAAPAVAGDAVAPAAAAPQQKPQKPATKQQHQQASKAAHASAQPAGVAGTLSIAVPGSAIAHAPTAEVAAAIAAQIARAAAIFSVDEVRRERVCVRHSLKTNTAGSTSLMERPSRPRRRWWSTTTAPRAATAPCRPPPPRWRACCSTWRRLGISGP